MREFAMTPVFDRLWNELGLDDDGLRDLQSHLVSSPFSGDVIRETGGTRKIRLALSNIGKSGGIRVI